MKKRIFNFQDYVNESYLIKEGIFSWLKSTIIDKFTGWTKDFFDMLSSGAIRKIKRGPKKGLPGAMLFVPENGPITDQVRNFYSTVGITESLDEAVVGTGWPGGVKSGNPVDKSGQFLQDAIIDLYEMKSAGERAKPIFMYGAPGIGKTEIVAEAATKIGCNFLFLDLETMLPEDFRGIPSQHEITPSVVKGGAIIDPGSGFTRDNPPSILPRDNGQNGLGGIVFLDEMNRAQGPIYNVLLKFVQAGRIGDYQLPDKWIIVGAGNRQEDDPDADIHPMSTALANRFDVYNFLPKPEEWEQFAIGHSKILPELPAFIMRKKHLFHKNDPDQGKVYPSPRSWTDGALKLAGKLKIKGLKNWRELPMNQIFDIFAPSVGIEGATDFIDYLKVLKEIPESDLDRALEDPDDVQLVTKAKTDIAVLYGIATLLLGRIDEYDDKKLYNALKYVSRYDENEVLSWMYKTLILGKYPEFTPLPTDKEGPKRDAVTLLTGKLRSSGHL